MRSAENSLFSQIPQKFSNLMIKVAHGVQKYLDSMADRLLAVLAHRSLKSASKMKKLPSTSLQHYIAAAIIGFMLILILIIVTVGV